MRRIIDFLIGLLACGAGGYAFGVWQENAAAGWFAFIALDAIYSIGEKVKLSDE